MSKYFKYFPLKQYDYYGDGVKSSIVDIYRMVAVDSIKIDDVVSYTYHEIKNGERPDVTSQMLYGTPDYHWTFFVLNPFLRAGMGAWFKDDHVMEKYLAQKYDQFFAIELKAIQTGPIDMVADIQVIDESGNIVTFTENVTATEVRGTLAGLDYSGITLGLKVVTDGYIGHVFPIVESDANAAQLVFRRDGISKVTVLDSGSDYIIAPSVSVIAASGYGIDAKVQASIAGGVISDVRLVNSGAGYTLESYQCLVKNTPTEDAKIAASVDEFGIVSIAFVPRPAGSDSSELYYRGKGYVKRPTLVVTPPAGGGTTAVFEVSVNPNTGALSSSDNTLSYTVVTPGVGYAHDEPVFVKIVNPVDSLGQCVAFTPPAEMFESGALTSAYLSLVPINPYLTTEAEYTTAQTEIDDWTNTTFYNWAIETMRISYYTLWQLSTPLEILNDVSLTLTPYRSWSSLRHAAHTYYDSAGKNLTVYEAQAISAQIYDTNANHETELNDSHRSIRVVRPENIMQFTEEYRKVLNQ
jgi:hypothetical protein